jgi:hypothetical protein
VPKFVADSVEATGLKWVAPSSPTGVGVLAVNTSAQTISNATDTVLNLNDEYWDTNSFHNPVTNNSRLTIPSGYGGFYIVFYKVTWATNTTGLRYAYAKLNGGSTLIGKGAWESDSDGVVTMVGTFLDKFTAGDYIELVVYQSSGGNLNTNGTYFTNFGLAYIGA